MHIAPEGLLHRICSLLQLRLTSVCQGADTAPHASTPSVWACLQSFASCSYFCKLSFTQMPKQIRSWLLQELHEKRVTLIEGTALSERDLVRARAESTGAILLLADRFSADAKQEDLSMQFQVCTSTSPGDAMNV